MEIFNILLVQPLANGLVLFYQLFGNLGLAIIGFTVALRLLLNPLTRPYMDSMKKMREYQKDLEKIKAKHKDDKQKQMKAQADFYKEKGINPGAGCLPYLLQIVILIAFFNFFVRVLNPDVNLVQELNALLYGPLQLAEDAVINTRFLYFDLTRPDVIKTPLLPFAIPGLLLILAAVSQFISAKISQPYIEAEKKMSQKTEQKTDDFQTAMMSSMVYTFPLITLVIGLNFPSGLALYWLIFSIFQVVQQYRSTGWGGMTPLLSRMNLIQLPDSKKDEHKVVTLKDKSYKSETHGSRKNRKKTK